MGSVVHRLFSIMTTERFLATIIVLLFSPFFNQRVPRVAPCARWLAQRAQLVPRVHRSVHGLFSLCKTGRATILPLAVIDKIFLTSIFVITLSS